MTTPSRLVRVFISSTFRDFIEERDELVKMVFPELRRRCKERFVEVLEVDLRWGITEEQSKSGETLRICLEEIDRCRPSAPVFFVGLLGERYGWIPPRDYFKPDVLEDPNLSWVKEHIDGKSVTELEILHGVLRNETMRDKSFFYFRNDGYQERHWAAIASHHKGILPPLTKEDFTNSKSPTPEADAARQRDLKQRVRDVSFKWDPKDYETPQNLASLILEDLWAAINEVFPASSVPDALERESLEHRVFMDSRTRAYVEREGLFEKLDAFANAPERDSLEEPPDQNQAEQSEDADAQTKEKKQPPSIRLVLGESGSGKSALLAAWLAKRETVFFHFTGATPTSVSGSSMLRRLLATLRKRGVVPPDEPVPQSDEAMAQILPTWLEKLSAQGGGIILFDAVNQLASARDRELWWWPEEWPANIRVIFSTLPGDSLREMARRGWTGEDFQILIPPLAPGEKRKIMAGYLKLFSRALDQPLHEKILASPQTANPLFLRTVLDELRLRSRHEDLSGDIDKMLACPDPAALFVHVLKNLERDFTPKEHPSLVHRALGLMGTALRGLSEGELLELLSPGSNPATNPLPRHYWAPLYLALEESLVSREGQLSFFHDYLRQAVWREYLDEAHERDAAHERLAEPATRWNEPDAFGSSLKAYGFANGIRHLLAIERTAESTSLLLDKSYRESAAQTLHNPTPILADVARVRQVNALADEPDANQAADLTVLALNGREQLTAHLRHTLDKAASESDWESVVALAAAEESESMRLILAFRALTRENAILPEKVIPELQNILSRWASESGKPELEELVLHVIQRAKTLTAKML
jgi:nephrocystin-3